MNFVVGDIHNDGRRFKELLKEINPGPNDTVFLLGDFFDRCSYDPYPLGVYYTVLELGDRCRAVSGNHDRWLAEYIQKYYSASEKERLRMQPYYYNSFDILRRRLPQADMLNLAEWIMRLPLQIEYESGSSRFLFAHAMTSFPEDAKDDDYYLMGYGPEEFYESGIDGYISFCSHNDTGYFARYKGRYLGRRLESIWVNAKKNVYMLDCGCGYSKGQLACLCIETGEEFYIS